METIPVWPGFPASAGIDDWVATKDALRDPILVAPRWQELGRGVSPSSAVSGAFR